MSLTIPQIVWTFFDKTNTIPYWPLFYQNCFETWLQHIPKHWKIYVLCDKTISSALTDAELPKHFHKLTPQRRSDCIRLALLAKYGGVWMDVGIILNKPISQVIPQDSSHQVIGYYIKKYTPKRSIEGIHNPVVESWFIASSPDNYLIRSWRDKMFLFLSHFDEKSIPKCKEVYKNRDTRLQIRNIKYKHYLFIHVVYQHLLVHDPKFREFHKSFCLYRKAEDTAFYEHQQRAWKMSHIRDYFKNYFTKAPSQQPLLKVRGTDLKTTDSMWVVITQGLFVLSFFSIIALFFVLVVKK